MNKKEFKKYKYELFELPDDDGNWFYVVRFKPVKPPSTLIFSRVACEATLYPGKNQGYAGKEQKDQPDRYSFRGHLY